MEGVFTDLEEPEGGEGGHPSESGGVCKMGVRWLGCEGLRDGCRRCSCFVDEVGEDDDQVKSERICRSSSCANFLRDSLIPAL